MSSPTDDISKPVNSPQIAPDAPNWFQVIKQGVNTSLTGLGLTWDHFWAARNHRAPIGIADPKYFQEPDGIFTLDYPFEGIAVPEVGRYQLHNEIEDCIVCDKCAKICPVDCIEIEVIKSPEVTGYTSDGTAKRLYAERFDIDMAKCCFCGLCTNVCPTDCLTMGNEIDVVTPVMADLTKAFSNLSPEEATAKKALYDTYLNEKESAKRPIPTPAPTIETEEPTPAVTKAPAKPWLKSSTAITPPPTSEITTPAEPTPPTEAPKPKAAPAKPWLKSSSATTPPPTSDTATPAEPTPPSEAPKPKAGVAKPWLKAKVQAENPTENSNENIEGGENP